MDKLIAFFKNIWFRRGVAVAGWGYTLFVVWIAYLSFGYYFDIEKPAPLFVLYLFVNICVMALFILSRKQIITQVNSYVLPPIIFAILIFSFGNWYISIPPIAVMLVVFFVNSSNETLKTVLGTMYLLMFVIGVVGYIGVQIFIGTITFTDVELSKRDTNYEKLSESGEYRIVRYFDTNGDRKLQKYFVETTEDDIKIPMGICKKVRGCKSIHTASYSGLPGDLVEWSVITEDGEKKEVLLVESFVRENPYLVKKIEEDDTSSGNDSSDSSDSSEESDMSGSSDSSDTDMSGDTHQAG
ncbi:MAG: hypothetical protein K2N56_09945 [Oscillospiraceae bacterium]|nr:hypothetical protein [Oscillospiraceae bacterium]